MASSALSQYWSKKWESGSLCDVVIDCQDGDTQIEVKCHSFILAPASPLFETLGNDEAIKKEKGEILVNDEPLEIIVNEENGSTLIKCKNIAYIEWMVLLHLLYYGAVKTDKLESHVRALASTAVQGVVEKLLIHNDLKNLAASYCSSQECASETMQGNNTPNTEPKQAESDDSQFVIQMNEEASQALINNHQVITIIQGEPAVNEDIGEVDTEQVEQFHVPDTQSESQLRPEVELQPLDMAEFIAMENDMDMLNAGRVEGVLSKCVYCWHSDKACDMAENLKCYLCYAIVERCELDTHMDDYHADHKDGFFTCLGLSRISANKKEQIIGETVKTVLDGKPYETFSCRSCQFVSAALGVFRKHLNTQHGAKSRITNFCARCTSCSLFFNTLKSKEDHEHFCSLKGWPFCEMCVVKFPTPSSYRKHVLAEHSGRAVGKHDHVSLKNDAKSIVTMPNKRRKVSSHDENNTDRTHPALRRATEVEVIIEQSDGQQVVHQISTEEFQASVQGQIEENLELQATGIQLEEGTRTDRIAVCLPCWSNKRNCSTKPGELMRCFMCFGLVPCEDLDVHTSQYHSHLSVGFFSCGKVKALQIPMHDKLIGKRSQTAKGEFEHMCTVCFFKTPSVKLLKQHFRIKHKINANENTAFYRCGQCFGYFTTETARDNHQHFCRGRGLPECLVCSMRLLTPSDLYAHLQSLHKLNEECVYPTNSTEQRNEKDPEDDDNVENYDELPLVEQGATEEIPQGLVSKCVFCWKNNKYKCSQAEVLKCFMCCHPVPMNSLDQHAKACHPNLAQGVFTCQMKRTSKQAENLHGLIARKDPNADKYSCELCDFVSDKPKPMKVHLVDIHHVLETGASLSQIGRCRVCLNLFSNTALADDHQYFCEKTGIKGKSILPKCDICGIKFSSPNAYRRHMKDVHNEQRKTNLDSYAAEMDITENKTPFSFTNSANERNVEFDRTDRKSVCVYCWKINQVCNEVELLKCFVCFETVFREDLDAHAEAHLNCNAGMYTCLGIHNGRLSQQSMDNYGTVGEKRVSDNPGDADTYVCRVCDFNTVVLQHFKNHLAENHGVKISKSNFVPRCRYCHVFFTANSIQEDHEYFCRGGDLPYCHECKMKFSSPNSWRRHCNELHSGRYGPKKHFPNSSLDRPLWCDICKISFKNRPAMRYHEKRKHNQQMSENVPYEERTKHVCNECGASFLRAHTLKEHINFRHTKDKQFKCKHCDRYFLRKSELARHEQMHGKAVAIKCSMCNFQGFTKFELKRHFFKDHKIGQFKCTCCRARFTEYEKYEEHKYLKLCPRYLFKSKDASKKKRVDYKSLEEAAEKQLEELEGPGEGTSSGDQQLCSWVTESGNVMQAYIQRDLLDSNGQLQEGLQLVELPNGEMRLVEMSTGETIQSEQGTEEAADHIKEIQDGKVELQLVEANIEELQQASEASETERKARVITEQLHIESHQHIDQSTDNIPHSIEEIIMKVEPADDNIPISTHPCTSKELHMHTNQIQETTIIERKTSVEYVESAANVGATTNIASIPSADTTVHEYAVDQGNTEEGIVEGGGGEQVTEMSLEAFQAAYGENALQAVEEEEGADGKYYIVYV